MHKIYSSLILLTVLFIGCGEKATKNKQIVVKNSLPSDRALETVSVPIASLEWQSKTDKIVSIILIDTETKKKILTQIIDANRDGNPDILLFQPKIKANSEKVFDIIYNDTLNVLDDIPNCYSRFVPERTDDYAWENNKVAFRTYGPTAQKMAEHKVKGGTLSSGMDAWLKRVNYPIINKWYAKTTSGEGTYHEDTGEGLDNFHVGKSRGVGGIAIKAAGTYHVSKNFISWEHLYSGPIRTSFILTYADWDAAGNRISEKKHISLDYGSNLSRFDITIKGIDTLSAGLTLHEKDGAINVNEKEGWASYWEPHEDSELGTGIVVPNDNMVGYEHYITEEKDQSNLFVHLKATQTKATYYAGFGWKKSGQFNTKSEWEEYLSNFAKRVSNPLRVEVR